MTIRITELQIVDEKMREKDEKTISIFKDVVSIPCINNCEEKFIQISSFAQDLGPIFWPEDHKQIGSKCNEPE